MRRYPGHPAPIRLQIILLTIFCAALGLCGVIALSPAVRVLAAYQPPRSTRSVSGPARDAHTERVVLVVVSRLATHVLSDRGEPWRFVELRRRAAEGARGSARAVQPSGDAPTWVALLSGAGPEESGIADDVARAPLPVATLFDQARLANKRSAIVAGPAAWKARAMLARPDRVLTARSSTAAGAAAVELLQERSEPLVVVLLDAARVRPDWTEDVAGRIDRQIGAIAAALDATRDTLIVTGDHGVLPDGSSGGHERDVLDVPLVLWGRAVVPGVLGTIDQRAIAATVATLLGLPYSGTEGRPLLDALDLDEPSRARETIAVLGARLDPPPAFVPASAVAEATRLHRAGRDALERHDWARARAAAEQGLAALIPTVATPRYVTSAWTWSAGLPLLLLAAAGLIGRFRRALAFLLVPLAGLGGYLLLWALVYFGLAGKSISLSAIYGDWRANLTQIALWSGLAFGAVAVGIAVARSKGGASLVVVETGWSALLVLGCLGSIVLVYLAVIGLPHGRLPGPAGWAGLLIAIAQIAGTGLAAPVALLLGATVAEVVSRGR